MIVKLDEIAISNEFREKSPNSWKMDKCREYYKRTGKQDRNIVVNHKGVLIDGYVMYLVLKEANVEYAIIKVSDHKENKKKSLLWTGSQPYYMRNTVYVYGKHSAKGKEYVWRVPESSKSSIVNIFPGDIARVATKYGLSNVVVTKVVEANRAPINIPIKKVVSVINK